MYKYLLLLLLLGYLHQPHLLEACKKFTSRKKKRENKGQTGISPISPICCLAYRLFSLCFFFLLHLPLFVFSHTIYGSL